MGRDSGERNRKRREKEQRRSASRLRDRPTISLPRDRPWMARDQVRNLSELAVALRSLVEDVATVFPVNEQCRVARYAALIERYNSPEAPAEIPRELRPEYLRARLEAQQFEIIHRTLASTPEIEGWRSRASAAFAGPATPDVERPDPARDTQSELFAASYMRTAGLVPRFEEPDVVVADESGMEFGIAVKRPKRLTAAASLIRAGVKQLAAHRKPGVVVVDLTSTLGLHGDVFEADLSTPDRMAGAAAELHRVLEDRLAKYRDSDLLGIRNTRSRAFHFAGVLLMSHALLFDPRIWRTVVLHRAVAVPTADASRHAQRLLMRLMQGPVRAPPL